MHANSERSDANLKKKTACDFQVANEVEMRKFIEEIQVWLCLLYSVTVAKLEDMLVMHCMTNAVLGISNLFANSIDELIWKKNL